MGLSGDLSFAVFYTIGCVPLGGWRNAITGYASSRSALLLGQSLPPTVAMGRNSRRMMLYRSGGKWFALCEGVAER